MALGHQLATSEDLAELAEAGAAMVTHLGNGMPNQMHRHNNVIFAAAAKSAGTPTVAVGSKVRRALSRFGPPLTPVAPALRTATGSPPASSRTGSTCHQT